MKLIVGLGNIGKKFIKTRHNIGFEVIDFFCFFMNFQLSDFEEGFNGMFLKQKNFILFKPCTFVNNSGIAVKKIADFYNIDVDDILVIQDDIYLPIGKIRLRSSGESGGHNGIKSIINNLKTTNFKRIKIGVEYSKNQGLLSNFVLDKFNDKELKTLKITFEIVSKILLEYLKSDFNHAVNLLNLLQNNKSSSTETGCS
ncbi:MAG: aminoacyl-tRNA hydrolase [Bacilli bacterium]|nr:aminoacyl-tRNA hydrolase [Bacilli bacterium]